MFSHITMNWRGHPLTSYQLVVDLIGATTTTTGLKIHAQLDQNEYSTGVTITEKNFKSSRWSATKSILTGTTPCTPIKLVIRFRALTRNAQFGDPRHRRPLRLMIQCRED